MAVNDYNTQIPPEYQNSIPPAMQFSDEENRIRGVNTTGVADDSFLGQSNAGYEAPVEVSPDEEESAAYVQRLGAIENQYKASAWDNPVDNSYKAQVSAPTAGDRIWNTMFNMGAALLLSGGNPAAMALAGFKSYTDDEDREYRYNQLDELQAQGYSLRTARDFVDTGDRRYLAEDRNGRIEAEKEQYNRDVDIRNFDEDVRRNDRTFQLDTDKFGEIKRSNLVKEGQDQQRINWDTNSKRLDTAQKDEFGNLILFDKMGNEIRVYGAGAVDENGKPTRATGSGDQQDGLSNVPYGYVMLDGSPMVHEKTAKGSKLRAPTATELKEFKVADDIDEESGTTPGREWMDKYISEENPVKIPSTVYGKSAILTGDRPLLSGALSKWEGGDAEKFYAHMDLMDAEGTIKGIDAAREAGASGINTVAEFETFKKGFPKLRTTTEASLRDSLREQKRYITNHNKKYMERQKKWVSVNTGEDGKYKVEGSRPTRGNPNSQSKNQQTAPFKINQAVSMPDNTYEKGGWRITVQGRRVVSVEQIN